MSESAAGKFEIVAVASSAGGITALGRVLGSLPAGLRVPLLIVQHLDPAFHRDRRCAEPPLEHAGQAG